MSEEKRDPGTPMIELLLQAWHWLTTTRYTRLLEEELARLRVENIALRNSIYARAGVPPVDYTAANGVAPRPKLPPPIRRAITWSQAKARLEALHRAGPGQRDAATAGSIRRDRPNGAAD